MLNSLLYISQAPYFIETLGLVMACSAWVGASVYNGDLKMLTKGIITIGSYAAFLYLITSTRVNNVVNTVGITNQVMAYAGLVTILVLTIFYILGMIIGVLTIYLVHKNKHLEDAQTNS